MNKLQILVPLLQVRIARGRTRGDNPGGLRTGVRCYRSTPRATESRSPLSGSSDATNNLNEGDKVLMLSRVGLTSLEGISKLRVQDQRQEKTLDQMERLHLYLNENAIHTLPAELYTMRKVMSLYLDFNKLGAIPPRVATMKEMTGMYFTGNISPSSRRRGVHP